MLVVFGSRKRRDFCCDSDHGTVLRSRGGTCSGTMYAAFHRCRISGDGNIGLDDGQHHGRQRAPASRSARRRPSANIAKSPNLGAMLWACEWRVRSKMTRNFAFPVVVAVAAVLAFGVCTYDARAGLLENALPSAEDACAGVSVTRGLKYGDSEQNYIDIATTGNADSAQRPVLLVVAGESFTNDG